MLKSLAKKILKKLHISITRNQKYDALTEKVMKALLKPDSNCIDVGCHKGEMLDVMLHLAPQGKHFAFEPLPDFYNALRQKYNGICTVLPYALSDRKGTTTFNYVVNAPAYSGLRKRKYDIKTPDIKEITVELELLDNLIPEDITINFIKIDVEGGELGVLKGAEKLLTRCKPALIFECGLGASDYYNTTPDEVFDLFERCGLKIYLMQAWLKSGQALTKQQFNRIFYTNSDYYFLAHP